MRQQVSLRLEWLSEIEDRGDCYSLSALAIKGKDLVSLGIKPGPRMGELLHLALDYVMRNPKENEKEILLSYLKKQ